LPDAYLPENRSADPEAFSLEERVMSAATRYKVSFVVEDGSHSGAIINMDHRPRVGEEIQLDRAVYEILEVEELIPPTDDFGFLHATCRRVRNLP